MQTGERLQVFRSTMSKLLYTGSNLRTVIFALLFFDVSFTIQAWYPLWMKQ